jgi:hypothetical protein
VNPVSAAKRFSRPAGGVPVWSRALLGSRVKFMPPPETLAALKVTTWAVGAPAYICALLNAHTRTFENEPLAEKPNMLADMYSASGQMPNFG